MQKKSSDKTITEINQLTYVADPVKYPQISKIMHARDDWPYEDLPIYILRELKNIYGEERVLFGTIPARYDIYAEIGISSAMKFKAMEIDEWLKKSRKNPLVKTNILWADVQIQKKYIAVFKEKISQAMKECPDNSNLLKTIDLVTSYDYLQDLTYDLESPSWSGRINPWQNLDFLQQGAAAYDKSKEYSTGLTPNVIWEQALIALSDDVLNSEKEKQGPDTVANATKQMADKIKLEYKKDIKKAKYLLDTQNDKIAQRFAYHYLFRNR